MVTLAKTGERIALRPHTDLWMRGVRYARLEFVGLHNVAVIDDSGRRHRLGAHGIAPIN